MRRHVRRDARAGRLLKLGHNTVAIRIALAVFPLMAAVPHPARADWNLGAEAGLRHDNNVGNARNYSDIVEDSIAAARLSVFQIFPLAESYSLSVAGDLNGEHFNRFTGLDNAAIDAALGLKKKWGLGAFAPWARAGISVARSDYDDHYRNAWVYRATLGAGRRMDERWNLWVDYAYERRVALTSMAEEVPGLSADAYSQGSHSITGNMEFSLSERTFLGVALLARHGDVVSTTSGSAQIFAASRALADDPTFGPDAYAYKLTGTTLGLRVGIKYSPTPHSLLGCGFLRLDTRAQGGNNYTKSMPEITFDYRF